MGRQRADQRGLSAPLLSGKDLNAYIASGIESDHECTRKEEAQERLPLGMWLMVREGTAAKNLRDQLPVITPQKLLPLFIGFG